MGEKADEAFEGSPQLPPPIPYGPCSNIRSIFRWDFIFEVHLVSEVLSELLVEPGGVHQALTVGVQPLVTLVQAGVHLGPVQVLGHPCGSSNDGRPLVRPVSVLLHVLGKVGLLQADTVLVYRIYNKSAGGAWPGDGMLTAGQYS